MWRLVKEEETRVESEGKSELTSPSSRSNPTTKSRRLGNGPTQKHSEFLPPIEVNKSQEVEEIKL